MSTPAQRRTDAICKAKPLVERIRKGDPHFQSTMEAIQVHLSSGRLTLADVGLNEKEVFLYGSLGSILAITDCLDHLESQHAEREGFEKKMRIEVNLLLRMVREELRNTRRG